MKNDLYFEDFAIDQQFSTEKFTINVEHAIRFAREYDPQYFHIDEQASLNSPFGRLIVSGWQTAAVTMRLKLTTPLNDVAGGLIGLGVDSMRWPKPTYVGDTIHAIITIMEMRLSQSKPTHGIVKYRVESYNQEAALVLEMVTFVWMPRRH